MLTQVRCSNGIATKSLFPSAIRLAFLLCSVLFLGAISEKAQCPDNGQTKVIKPEQGTGYYFYKFIGDSSFLYFLDGNSFSFNEKDDPGKTFIFIDDFSYEPVLFDKSDLAKYVQSSKPVDVLSAQAKYEQDYFKKTVPSIVITDYGPSARKNPDGSDGQLFYLWKKENPPGGKDARQYLVSTFVPGGVFVLSFMPLKASVSEDDVFLQIQKYTSHFDLLSAERCAKALAAPTAR